MKYILLFLSAVSYTYYKKRIDAGILSVSLSYRQKCRGAEKSHFKGRRPPLRQALWVQRKAITGL